MFACKSLFSLLNYDGTQVKPHLCWGTPLGRCSASIAEESQVFIVDSVNCHSFYFPAFFPKPYYWMYSNLSILLNVHTHRPTVPNDSYLSLCAHGSILWCFTASNDKDIHNAIHMVIFWDTHAWYWIMHLIQFQDTTVSRCSGYNAPIEKI